MLVQCLCWHTVRCILFRVIAKELLPLQIAKKWKIAKVFFVNSIFFINQQFKRQSMALFLFSLSKSFSLEFSGEFQFHQMVWFNHSFATKTNKDKFVDHRLWYIIFLAHTMCKWNLPKTHFQFKSFLHKSNFFVIKCSENEPLHSVSKGLVLISKPVNTTTKKKISIKVSNRTKLEY